MLETFSLKPDTTKQLLRQLANRGVKDRNTQHEPASICMRFPWLLYNSPGIQMSVCFAQGWSAKG